MRRPIAVLAAFALSAIALIATGTHASAYNLTGGAWSGYCNGTGSPKCYWWNGKVTNVSDGDTFDIDVYGDGTSTPIRARVVGINAMELHTYSSDASKRAGDCWGVEATDKLESWIRKAGWHVRIAAQSPGDMSGSRYHRAIYAQINGKWYNLALSLVKEGLALWMSSSQEYAWNETYDEAMQQAAAAHRGLFSLTHCGIGPSQSANLKLDTQWDADGADGASGPNGVNGEWVRIRNNGDSAVSLAGWYFRDSMLRYTTLSNGKKVPGFVFPSYASVPAHGGIALYMGKGTNTSSRPTTFYWNQTASIFENNADSGPNYHLGDGSYLFDPQGDLRFWSIYPCLVGCSDPLAGKVRLAANYGTPSSNYHEYVDVTNTSTQVVDLTDYLIKSPPYSYTSLVGVKLLPGATLRLYTQQPGNLPGDVTRTVRSWGQSGPILNNDGDEVSLRTYDEVPLSSGQCVHWGSRSHCVAPATS
jgi:endonuclease YncB( thermonuclease family)